LSEKASTPSTPMAVTSHDLDIFPAMSSNLAAPVGIGSLTVVVLHDIEPTNKTISTRLDNDFIVVNI
jgi:hypothetical protein